MVLPPVETTASRREVGQRRDAVSACTRTAGVAWRRRSRSRTSSRWCRGRCGRRRRPRHGERAALLGGGLVAGRSSAAAADTAARLRRRRAPIVSAATRSRRSRLLDATIVLHGCSSFWSGRDVVTPLSVGRARPGRRRRARLNASTVSSSAAPGNAKYHQAVLKIGVASAIISPQLAVRRVDADAEVGERRLEQDVLRDQKRRVDDDRRDQVRQDLPADDPRSLAPSRARPRRTPSRAATGLAADDPRDVGPVDDDDRHDHRRQPRLDRPAAQPLPSEQAEAIPSAEQQDRERQHDVDHARDERVGRPAVSSRRPCRGRRRSTTASAVATSATSSETRAP